MDVLAPHQKQMAWRRISPARRLRKLRRIYGEIEHLAEVLPRKVLDIVELFQAGKIDVHLDHRGLEPSVNRLVLGMLASALFLGSSLLLSRQVPPLLSESVPLVGGVSFFGLSWLRRRTTIGRAIVAPISKSGHLDRRD